MMMVMMMMQQQPFSTLDSSVLTHAARTDSRLNSAFSEGFKVSSVSRIRPTSLPLRPPMTALVPYTHTHTLFSFG